MSKQIGADCPPFVAEAIAALPDGSQHMADAVRRYLMHGTRPGHFLSAVLANDLRRAAMHADHHNASNLYEWGRWLQDSCPAVAMGDDWAVTHFEGFADE